MWDRLRLHVVNHYTIFSVKAYVSVDLTYSLSLGYSQQNCDRPLLSFSQTIGRNCAPCLSSFFFVFIPTKVTRNAVRFGTGTRKGNARSLNMVRRGVGSFRNATVHSCSMYHKIWYDVPNSVQCTILIIILKFYITISIS